MDIIGINPNQIPLNSFLGDLAYRNSEGITINVGTTPIPLDRISANQGLTGISSVSFPGQTSGTITLSATAIAGTNTITLPAVSGTAALTSDIKEGTLTLSTSPGSTNTAVIIGTGTGFHANVQSNIIYDVKVGPALTALATTMTGATVGLLKKTSADTYSLTTVDITTSHTATNVTVTSSEGTSGGTINAATTSLAGVMTATDKTKLDGIAQGAEVNVNADWNAVSGDAAILNKPTLGTAASKNISVNIEVVASLPGSPNTNTLYIVTG